jgi:hypothetical protein
MVHCHEIVKSIETENLESETEKQIVQLMFVFMIKNDSLCFAIN